MSSTSFASVYGMDKGMPVGKWGSETTRRRWAGGKGGEVEERWDMGLVVGRCSGSGDSRPGSGTTRRR